MSRTKRNIIPILILTMLFVLSFSVTSVFAASLSKKNVKIGKNNVYVLYLYGASGNVQWTSKKKGVAQIVTGDSTKAIIRAKKKGKSVITANVNGQKITCKFNVKDTKGIPKSLTVLAGDSVVFQQNKKKGTWSTSNPEIGYVEGTGKKKRVSFYNPGIVVITETIGNRRYSCTVTVIDRNTGTTTSYDDTSNPSNSGGGSSGGIIFPPYNPSTPAKDTYDIIQTDIKFEENPVTVTLGTKTVVGYTPSTYMVKSHNTGEVKYSSTQYTRFAPYESQWPSGWNLGWVSCVVDENAHTITLDTAQGLETLQLPVTGKIAIYGGGKKYDLTVTINDWGTPDKQLLNEWLNKVRTACDKNKGDLDYLTNCTKYIAEHYGYNNTNRYMYDSNGNLLPKYKYINHETLPCLTVFGYIEGFANKYGTPLGSSCSGSTDAIIRLAKKRGLQAKVYDDAGPNDNHELAQVKIGGQWYLFECGNTGNVPRRWSVHGPDGQMIAIGDANITSYDGFVTYSDGSLRNPNYYPR